MSITGIHAAWTAPARLMSGNWVKAHQNVLICGATGVGKTFLACALANQAGHSLLYVRLPRLLPTLAIGRSDGIYAKTLAQLAKPASWSSTTGRSHR